ncbi:hypothetical protein TNCV_1901931 [Trichonephila clavipes]|nr:hypothetical protein TNCV_1901931 [Trichonephila clavipes]
MECLSQIIRSFVHIPSELKESQLSLVVERSGGNELSVHLLRPAESVGCYLYGVQTTVLLVSRSLEHDNVIGRKSEKDRAQ